MKHSASYKIFPITALLSVLSVVHAQEAGNDAAVATEEETRSSPVRVLHFEPPISLAKLAEQPALELIAAPSLPVIADQGEERSVFANLSPNEQAYLQRLQDIDSYEQALEELEFQGGAWSVQIAEELAILGSLLYQQGDYEESIEVFDRAVHINRVNHGLFSPEQIPLVEKLVDSHVALGQWREADEQQQYAFFVQTKTYGARDPRMISVFQNLARWNITTFYRGIDPDPTQRLLQTFLLYRAAADTVEAHFGQRDPRYIELLQDVAGAADMMNRYALEGSPAGTAGNPDRRMVNNFVGSPTNPQGGSGGGESALRRIVNFYSDDDRPNNQETLLLRVRAMANIGDWHLTRERRQAAMRAYRDAYEELLDAENGEALVEQVFGEIVFLPTFSNFGEEKKVAFNLNADSGAQQGYVDMSFDVSQYGRATNFQLLAMEPQNLARVESQVVSMVRTQLVRPKIVEGRTVASQGESYRFHFWYQ
ncbi:MAG: hypothetical protein Q8L60_15730 [Gammaproteobacteria bacterium]|nr:hypothetical protein [Gammaproteobacteria bacterium]MDP2346507.1 hypothetical protein [Gammaproteobacteria bacterium]